MDLIQSIRIAPADFDSDVGGWRVPFLQLPGITVKEEHFDGQRIDLDTLEVNTDTGILRFDIPSGKTRKLTIVCSMPQRIVLPDDAEAREKAHNRMKWLAAIIPLIAIVLGAFAKPFAEYSVPALFSTETSVVDITAEPLSNDILADVWTTIAASDQHTDISLVGLNFHRTALDGDDHILNAVRNGANIRVVVPTPTEELYANYEREYGADSAQLKAECELGLEGLKSLKIECNKVSASDDTAGTLQIRTVGFMPNARMYRFDRGGAGADCFVVSYIRGRKSSDTPALVFDESSVLDSTYESWFEHVWSGARDVGEPSDAPESANRAFRDGESPPPTG